MKIAIIGAGNVGASIAYAAMIRGTASEISLIDVNHEKALGEALDLSHGGSFVKASEVYAEDFSGCKNADIIVVTAGLNRKPNETRLDLMKKNAEAFKNILPQIMKYNSNPLLIIVSNPVDVLTQLTLKITGLPSNRVIGSGTVLDSSRFRYTLSSTFKVDARNVHAYIIGEHGGSAVPVWSRTNIGGVSIEDFCKTCDDKCAPEHQEEIFNEVLNAGKEVIQRKGATYYAVALSVERILAAILRDENSVLTVSSMMQNIYGISDVCFSWPQILNKNGIDRALNLQLDPVEIDKLKKSAAIIREFFDALEV